MRVSTYIQFVWRQNSQFSACGFCPRLFYEALQNLLIEYKGKVDVIYIDPPYGKDSMGEFAHTNYDNAITRDNLLSMLYSRLVLAKELLSDTGVILCYANYKFNVGDVKNVQNYDDLIGIDIIFILVYFD